MKSFDNWVNKLQEYIQKNKHLNLNMPEFSFNRIGNEFKATCFVNSYKTHGFGGNKKDAKQESCKAMFEKLKINL